jgi:hypothetical protein
MSAVATLLGDKRTSNAANLTASSYEYTALISCVEIASLGSVQAGSSDHDVIEHHAIGRAAQLLEDFRRSKPSGDGGKHIELRLLIFF